MTQLEYYFLILLIIQVVHSLEELIMGFHQKFPILKMSFRFFLSFEVLFLAFWVLVFVYSGFPFRNGLLYLYNIMMFANGIWHLFWWGMEKKYVPGIATAPLFILVFLAFYFEITL